MNDVSRASGRRRSMLMVTVLLSSVLQAVSGSNPAEAAEPPGGKIAFTSGRDGNFEIYVMDPDGSGQTNLTRHPSLDNTPAFSPDGSRIAFTSFRDGNREIYVMNADGSSPVNLSNAPSSDETKPVWSPDGWRIAFSSDRDGDDDIYVMNADGTGAIQLTNKAGDDVPSDWSPDGSRIAFMSTRTGNFEIFEMKADGSEQRNVSNHPGLDNAAVYAPDGLRFAFHTDRDQGYRDLHLMDIDGTNLFRIQGPPDMNAVPSWSPDGTRLAYMTDRHGGDQEIYRIDLEGIEPVRLTTSSGVDTQPDWWGVAPPLLGRPDRFDFSIPLRSRVLDDPGVDQAFISDIRARTDRSHGIVQLQTLPQSNKRIDALRSVGIELLDYLPATHGISTAYLASFGQNLDPNAAAFGQHVRGLRRLQSQDKIQPFLDHVMSANSGHRKVVILFFPDVSNAQASNTLATLGIQATRLGSDAMWEASISRAELDRLSSHDTVQWVQDGADPVLRLDEARASSNVDPVQQLNTGTGVYAGLAGDGVQIGIMDSGVDTSHIDFSGRMIRSQDAGGNHGTHVGGIAAGSGFQSDKNDDAGNPNTDPPNSPAGVRGTPFQWRGVAPMAQIAAYGMSGTDESVVREAVETFGVDVSNHSYGYNSQGDYDARSQVVDRIIRGDSGFRPHTMVWAVGNNAITFSQDCDGDGINDGMFPQEPGACATAYQAGYFSVISPEKNSITVGSIDDDLTRAPLSSIGPTFDGRVQPLVVANGRRVLAPGGDTTGNGAVAVGNDYEYKGGTSMAAPVVTGVVALMMQQYAKTFSADLDTAGPLPSTVRAALVQTAIDLAGTDTTPNFDTSTPTTPLGTPYGLGPDRPTGFGLVDAQAAVQLIRDRAFKQGSMSWTDPLDTYEIWVEPGQTEARVTLAWDDPAGTPNANAIAAQLVNDLDLVLLEPDGTVHRPLVLPAVTPRDCNAAAAGVQVATCIGQDPPNQSWFGPASEGTDRRNNIEQVVVRDTSGLPPGRWTAIVSAASIAPSEFAGTFVRIPVDGEQDYSIAGVTAARPDDFELNDTPASARPIGPDFLRHVHLRYASAPSDQRWRGEDRERWLWSVPELTLHDSTDQDHFRLSLPDPTAPQGTHDPMPECGLLARPARFQFEQDTEVLVRGTFSASTTASEADLRVRNASTGEDVGTSVTCPRTERGLTEAALAVGESRSGERFPTYELSADYTITLQTIARPSDWLQALIDLHGFRGVGGLPCPQGGVFPHCNGPEPFFTFRHPFGGDQPDCRADGPGCWDYFTLNWASKRDMRATFFADRSLKIELYDLDGRTLGKGRPQQTGTSRDTAGSAPPMELVVGDLEPGFYVLGVFGHETDVGLSFDAPPPPADSDGDGFDDPYDVCPGQAEDFDGIWDGDGCPEVDADEDGLTDEEEKQRRTDPLVADTDRDGVKDGDEVKTHHSDPLDRDTDGDLYGDGTEVRAGSDPSNPFSFPTPAGPVTLVDPPPVRELPVTDGLAPIF